MKLVKTIVKTFIKILQKINKSLQVFCFNVFTEAAIKGFIKRNDNYY